MSTWTIIRQRVSRFVSMASHPEDDTIGGYGFTRNRPFFLGDYTKKP